jgi:hypothetical protein
MSMDLEEAIAETLRPRGDGPVDVAALRMAAVRHGRAIRRRRWVTAGAGLAAAAVVVGMIPFVRAGMSGGSGTGIGGPGIDRPPGVLALPPADAPGAAANPAAVGRDPSVLHFDVDLTGMLATRASWFVMDGVERLSVMTSDFGHFNHDYQLSIDPAKAARVRGADIGQPADTRQVTVGGRPATATFWPSAVSHNKNADVPTWSVRWQPVDGLWASVDLFTTDVTEAVRAAGAMVLNSSQRCVAPLRLDPALTGFTLTACSVDVGHDTPWVSSSVDVERPDGVRFDIAIGDRSLSEPFVPNRMVGGRQAMITATGQAERWLFVPITGKINLVVRPYRLTMDGDRVVQAPAGLTDDELVAFASAITVGPNLTEPDTWPASPLG